MTTSAAGAPPSRPLSLMWTLAARREYGLAILLALIMVTVSIRSVEFIYFSSLSEIFANASQVAIIASGVMLVIITGEIDISVGAAMGFLTAILALMVVPADTSAPGWGWPVWLGILITLSLGTLIGLINGLLVTLVRVPSIIVTLAMLMILKSLTVKIMSRNIGLLPPDLRFFGLGIFPSIPWGSTRVGIIMPIWIMITVLIGTWAMLRYTPVGRRIFAVGSNPAAATLSGLSVTRIKIFAFALTGFLVGVATLITQLAMIDSSVANTGLELLVVTCVVVGGVSISGGTGTVLGVFLGVILLTVQKKVLLLLKLGPSWSYWDKAIQGALILVAVLIDHIASRRSRRGDHP